MIDILPARTNPHRSGDNQTLGRPILSSHDNRLDRIDAVLHGVQANQIQLVALVSALTSAFMEYLLDEQQQQELGIKG